MACLVPLITQTPIATVLYKKIKKIRISLIIAFDCVINYQYYAPERKSENEFQNEFQNITANHFSE